MVAGRVKLLKMRDIETTVSLNWWHRSEELFPVGLDIGLFASFVQGIRICRGLCRFSSFSFFPFLILLSLLFL